MFIIFSPDFLSRMEWPCQKIQQIFLFVIIALSKICLQTVLHYYEKKNYIHKERSKNNFSMMFETREKKVSEIEKNL